MTLPSSTMIPPSHKPEGLREYCGVFGILDRQAVTVSDRLYFGLFALQHRGQESCGMAVFDHDQLRLHKEMGLVHQVFTQPVLDTLTGQLGIGHTRYSTYGASHLSNAQPMIVHSPLGAIALAHNGNLINTRFLSEFLEQQGHLPSGDSDSHLMLERIHYELVQSKKAGTCSLEDAVENALSACEGAFSVVLATGDALIAARDPYGFRPLCLGKTPTGALVVASETCALDIVGAVYERDILPGEMLVLKRDGSSHSRMLASANNPTRAEHFCVFELVYFARPDSRINGSSVYTYRLNLGKRLAEISPEIEADYVIPVPDSGNVAAIGYSQASGIPYAEGLIKNRYVGRTFIQPGQSMRKLGIQLKLNPLRDVLNGKRIVVVDDSIVRGNTSKKLVQMLKSCGVKEIHLRVSSAPVKNPCFYGIDMPTYEELIASRLSIEETRAWLGVDSLVYLSPEDMQDIAQNESVCMACFNGQYQAGTPESFLLKPATAITAS